MSLWQLGWDENKIKNFNSLLFQFWILNCNLIVNIVLEVKHNLY